MSAPGEGKGLPESIIEMAKRIRNADTLAEAGRLAKEIVNSHAALTARVKELEEALLKTPHRLGDIACGREWTCACGPCVQMRRALGSK